jgi:hypothetical protein
MNLDLFKYNTIINISLLFLLVNFLQIKNVNAQSDLKKEQCHNVDLAPELGPNRFPQSSEWCWAYSSSDALGHALGITPSEQISAFDFATQVLATSADDFFKKYPQHGKTKEEKAKLMSSTNEYIPYFKKIQASTSTSLSETGYGAIPGAMIYSTHPGYCSQKTVDAFNLNHDSLPIQEQLSKNFDYQYIPIVKKRYLKALENCKCFDPQLCNLIKNAANVVEVIQTARQFDFQLSQKDNLLLLKEKNKELKKVSEKLNNVCKPRKAFGEFDILSTPIDHNKPEITKGITAFIMAKRTPILVSMDPSILWGRSPVGSIYHQAIIDGSQWNEATQKCEFKLRNTAPCDDYTIAKYRDRCSDGEVWLDEDDFAQMIYGIEIIAPKGKFTTQAD